MAKSLQFDSDELPQLLLGCASDPGWSTMADLGCGEGVILNALGNRGLLEGKSVYAVDMTEERVNRANRTYTHIKCLTADVCHTPIESDSIDLLITTQVIEHVDDDEDLVKEIQRVLAPGGIAYVDTIFKKWYGWYFYRCNGKWTMDPTHVREYGSDAELLDHFHRHGLKILANEKSLRRVPLVDSVLRRLGASRDSYNNNKLLRFLKKFSLPIPGYYIWGLVCKKQSDSPVENSASEN